MKKYKIFIALLILIAIPVPAFAASMLETILAFPIELLVSAIQKLEQINSLKTIDSLVFDGAFPFGVAEWNTLKSWYVIMGIICQGLILLTVVITGMKLTYSAINPRMRSEATESFGRLFCMVFIVALAPLFISTIFNLNDAITNGLKTLVGGMLPNGIFNISSFVARVDTGNAFATAIVKLMFLGIEIYVNVIFAIRKFVLAVLFVFTPFMAIMWAINKNVNAAGIWVGEILSNAFMSTAYALTFTIFCILSPSQGWFYSLIWTISFISVAEMLRNSFQGLMTRLSGFDEARTAGFAVASAFGLGGLSSISRVANSSLGAPYGYILKNADNIAKSSVSDQKPTSNPNVSLSNQPTNRPSTVNPSYMPITAKTIRQSYDWGNMTTNVASKAAGITFAAIPGGQHLAEGATNIVGGMGRTAVMLTGGYLNLRNESKETGKSKMRILREEMNTAGDFETEKKEGMKVNLRNAKALWRTGQIIYSNFGASRHAVNLAQKYATEVDGFRWR